METVIFTVDYTYELFFGGFFVGFVLYFIVRSIQAIFDSFNVFTGINKDV